MQSTMTRLTLATIFTSCVALSFTANALPQASVKDVASLKQACQQIALEDQLPEAEIASFLLDCVNDQLTEMGYERITSLD
ncbi:hypothetical protein [Shewanella ulleungensis]|uniref:Uncharacterized protein n=1 Tax=Shewanella ulleungensis TaxID=2282699 RepID=A0ABQ2QHT6_9GAMM|nr:hypothetical protein [Shewanella ulleungensis]MCL1149567.1 hypothetical protein [Shewanella ulleungensis]GGP79944.1 hypothetical protein GCM10009410_10690 [Shewanella ulleungensis]